MGFIQEIVNKIKDGAFVINLNDHKSITYWIALYVNSGNLINSDGFGVE